MYMCRTEAVAMCCSPLVGSGVSEMVHWLMDHVLSVNPRHPSWLRTRADIHFGVYFAEF